MIAVIIVRKDQIVEDPPEDLTAAELTALDLNGRLLIEEAGTITVRLETGRKRQATEEGLMITPKIIEDQDVSRQISDLIDWLEEERGYRTTNRHPDLMVSGRKLLVVISELALKPRENQMDLWGHIKVSQKAPRSFEELGRLFSLIAERFWRKVWEQILAPQNLSYDRRHSKESYLKGFYYLLPRYIDPGDLKDGVVQVKTY